MITIELDRGSYRGGETVKAKITLSFSKPVNARALEAKLVCLERKIIKTQTIMDHSDYRDEKDLGISRSTHIKTDISEENRTVFSQVKKIGAQAAYTTGEFDVDFTLPANAPATSHEFGHDNKTDVWTLHVKLDIPFALDKNASKEVIVGGLGE